MTASTPDQPANLDGVLATPALRPCIDLWVDVGAVIDVGAVQLGGRRVVPIQGGRAVGLQGGWTARAGGGHLAHPLRVPAVR